MKDPNKHYVIVPRSQVENYLLRGYARSSESIRDHLPIVPEDIDDLVLMETSKVAHEAANTPPVRFMVDFGWGTLISGAAVARLEVLGVDDEDGRYTYAGKGDGATRIQNDDMFETPRYAVAAAAPEIRAAIDAHRATADKLEAFLKSHDL